MNTKLKDMKIVLFMDFYEILEIDQGASTIEIKKSYRRLAKLYHPDKNENNEIKMKDINLAYEVLSDNKLKEDYDRTIEYNEEPYDLIQNIIKKNKLDVLNHLFNFIYDDEIKLKNDINEMNFVNMLKTVKDKVKLDISSKIDISLKDIYENNSITLVVKRNIHGILKDFEIKINLDVYDEIEKLSPFGSANSEPKFLVENVRIIKSRVVGKKHISSILASKSNVRKKIFRRMVSQTFSKT